MEKQSKLHNHPSGVQVPECEDTDESHFCREFSRCWRRKVLLGVLQLTYLNLEFPVPDVEHFLWTPGRSFLTAFWKEPVSVNFWCRHVKSLWLGVCPIGYCFVYRHYAALPLQFAALYAISILANFAVVYYPCACVWNDATLRECSKLLYPCNAIYHVRKEFTILHCFAILSAPYPFYKFATLVLGTLCIYTLSS